MNTHKSFSTASATKQNEKEINLREVYFVIRRKLWIIALSTLILTGIGYMYANQPITPLYESSTRIHIQANDDLFNTVMVIMREPAVMREVVNRLELNRSPESLRNQISTTSVDGSTVLRIGVVDQDPAIAAQIANSIVSAYQKVARNTVFESDIIVLSEAIENPNRINHPSDQALYVGLIVGLLLGLGIVFIVDSLDDTVRSEKEVEQLLGVTVIGRVSKIKKKHTVRKSGQQKIPLRGETIGS